MKFFKSMFLLLALMFVALPAFAQDTPNPCADIPKATEGKGPTETSTILDLCRAGAAKNVVTIGDAKVAVPEAKEVSEWSQALGGFADGIVTVANGLGIAVNDFMKSPAGVLLALILLLNYAGGVIIGVPFVMFTILVFAYMFRRVTIDSISYENVPMFWGMITVRRRTVVKMTSIDGDSAGVLAVTGFALLLLNLIVCLNV